MRKTAPFLPLENPIAKKQICSVVITYNPDENILQLVNIIKSQVDRIIIVDNNSENGNKEMLLKLGGIDSIEVVFNSENLGIASALNQGIAVAIKKGYDWVITFDQDSLPYQNIIKVLTDVYNAYPEKQRIGAIGINYPSSERNSYPTRSKIKKYRLKDYLITSGCLMRIKEFVMIGGFKEDFFIDNVDLEYSLRLRANGKVLLISDEWGMKHQAGAPNTSKFLGLNLVSTHHNSFRRYYMARNHVILSKQYIFRFPYFIAKANFFFFLSLVKIFLVEKDKRSKMLASLKGVLDGLAYSLK